MVVVGIILTTTTYTAYKVAKLGDAKVQAENRIALKKLEIEEISLDATLEAISNGGIQELMGQQEGEELQELENPAQNAPKAQFRQPLGYARHRSLETV